MRPKAVSREEILRAAGELIREEGLEACSMRCLADRCGIAVGTLYNYFPSHRNLLEELYISSWTLTIEKLNLIPDTPVQESLMRFIHTLESEVKGRNRLGIILYGGRLSLSSLSPKELTVYSGLHPILIRILRGQQSYRDLPREELELNARWILMLVMDYLISGSGDIEILKRQIRNRFL